MDPAALVERLAAAPVDSDAYNEYAGPDAHNAVRRANLLCYLQQMAARRPQTLLVMEAPGYRGCRLTGVPVTSRKILLEGLPGLGLFGRAQGYQDPADPGFERIQGEQSATIVWGTLAELGQVPLIWNAFPFHPHRMGQPLSNRRPRRSELAQGALFLQELLALFRPRQVIAVGGVAEEVLAGLGHAVPRVRHPAQGGRNAFVAGITTLLAGPG